MFLNAPNPTQVQFTPASRRASPPPPLVLIHDGGGTTFSYFILGNLRRDVWAIHDPRHWDASSWEGGIHEMARHYVDLIEAAGISGPILLGGWSLGGLLSLAMARMLADDRSRKFTVAGILIIDSHFHERQPVLAQTRADPAQDKVLQRFLDDCPELVRKSFEKYCIMLDAWGLPEWDGPTCGGKDLQLKVAGKTMVVEHGSVLHKPVGGSWKSTTTNTCEQQPDGELASKLVSPPPAVMIRCTQRTECFAGEEYRHEMLLGWESKYPEFIKAVIDVDAKHFTIFDKSDHAKMKSLTAQLNEALDMLDSLKYASCEFA